MPNAEPVLPVVVVLYMLLVWNTYDPSYRMVCDRALDKPTSLRREAHYAAYARRRSAAKPHPTGTPPTTESTNRDFEPPGNMKHPRPVLSSAWYVCKRLGHPIHCGGVLPAWPLLVTPSWRRAGQYAIPGGAKSKGTSCVGSSGRALRTDLSWIHRPVLGTP